MDEQGEEFVGLALAKAGSERTDADEKLLGVRERNGVWRREIGRNERRLALLTMLMASS